MTVLMTDYESSDKDSKSFVIRFIYKPDTEKVWGFNKFHFEEQDPNVEEEPEEEVDLSKTMWMVLRKNRAHNKMLRKLFAEN